MNFNRIQIDVGQSFMCASCIFRQGEPYGLIDTTYGGNFEKNLSRSSDKKEKVNVFYIIG